MKQNRWIVATALGAWLFAVGCGGNGNGVFSTTTTTAGTFDPQRPNQGQGTNPSGGVGPALAGDEIMMSEFTEDGQALSLLNPASKNLSSVAKLGADQYAFCQSPQGLFVAFVAKRDAAKGLFVNTTNTLDRAIPLGPNTFASFGSIQFSPDGKRVVAAGEIGSDPSAVFVASVDGKFFRKLDEGDEASISPNGKQIVYSKVVAGKSTLFTRGIDGKGEKKITDGKSDDILAQWSKDGRRILFTSNRDGKFGLYAVSAGGGKVTKIMPDAYGGTFSPDGKRVAFSRIGAKPEESGVFVAPIGGGAPIRLFERPIVSGPLFWTTPSVAPGKNADQPGPIAVLMSARAKMLLRLPDIKAPKPPTPAPTPEATPKPDSLSTKSTGG